MKKTSALKSRQLLSLVSALLLPFVFGGCSRKPPPGPIVQETERVIVPIAQETERVILTLIKPGGNTLIHQDDAAIKVAMQRSVAANRINSIEDISLAGSDVPVEEILRAAKRKWSLPDEIAGELTRIAKDVDPSDTIDFGAAVVEAHCGGLKQELETEKPSTAMDYTVHFAIAIVKSRVPTPRGKGHQIGEDLVKVAAYLRARTENDEAARRAYIKGACKIPRSGSVLICGLSSLTLAFCS